MLEGVLLLITTLALGAEPAFDNKHALQELYKSGCVDLPIVEFAGAGKPALTKKSDAAVRALAQVLKEERDLKVRVVVHGEKGEAFAMLDLAKRRAQAIVRALTGKGALDPARVTIEALPNEDSAPDGCRPGRAYLVEAGE